MGRRKMSKAAKKARTGLIGQSEVTEEEYKKAPHSLVFHRGRVGKNIRSLVRDMRRVMEPYTASQLQVKRANVLKDFVTIAGPLNISHFLVFTKTNKALYLKLMRLPHGPTLTFRVESYSLLSDIISSIKRHYMDEKQLQQHPLLVMNNFSGEGLHLKLMTTMFQNLFPSINVNKVKLRTIRRCVLLNLNKDDGIIEFRHYNIKAVPVGMSRAVKKLIQAKVPNLSRLQDMSEYLNKEMNLSESEAELDGPHNEVILPQSLPTRGNMKSGKSAIRLTEIGPRMTLKLIKIQDGLNDGEVLYHSLVTKTQEEQEAMKEARTTKKKLKMKRKQQQEENIQRKKREKEEHKARSLQGMRTAEERGAYEGDAESESEDDAAYFTQEVGEAPDPDLGLSKGGKSKRKASSFGGRVPGYKRPRLTSKSSQGRKENHRSKTQNAQREMPNKTGKRPKDKKLTMRNKQNKRRK